MAWQPPPPGLHRRRWVVDVEQPTRAIVEGQACVHFANNDVLGLGGPTSLLTKHNDPARFDGLGSGGSPHVSGYTSAHRAVEQAFCRWLQAEAALLFSSGFHANLGCLTALLQRGDTLLSDACCHASIVDGALLARARLRRYRHQSVQDASRWLARCQPSWLVTESTFSVHGTSTALPELMRLTQEANCGMMVDDAHGIGVHGPTGGGVAERYPGQLPCVVVPLGKALHSFGAVVVGHAEVIERIHQQARSYRYSTALPPSLCDNLLARLTLVQHQTWRRTQLHERHTHFAKLAKQTQLPLAPASTPPIHRLVLGCAQRCVDVQANLHARGYWVAAMRPPSVATEDEACLRISMNAQHTDEDIAGLVEALNDALEATA